MGHTTRHFIPAAGHDWLLPLYDPLQAVMGGNRDRRAAIERAGLCAGQRVLDIGCGTGSLAVEIARLHPEVEMVALDPDPKALGRAEAKARRAGVTVRFERGFSDELPFPEGSLDHVFSSYMFHHLEPDVKKATLAEVRRVLRPGGSLHLIDFGSSDTRGEGFLARLLHDSEPLTSQYRGGIQRLMGEVGLDDVAEVDQRRTLFGNVIHYRAVRTS